MAALCTATRWPVIPVDETYRESALNSLRTVDIYVLEWGNGTLYY